MTLAFYKCRILEKQKGTFSHIENKMVRSNGHSANTSIYLLTPPSDSIKFTDA